MAVVRLCGKPDIFLTFTCNGYWDEIVVELKEGQKAEDRPNLTARVFRLKLDALLNDILQKDVFGKVSSLPQNTIVMNC